MSGAGTRAPQIHGNGPIRTHIGKLPSYTRLQAEQLARKSFTWGGFCLRGRLGRGSKLGHVEVVSIASLRYEDAFALAELLGDGAWHDRRVAVDREAADVRVLSVVEGKLVADRGLFPEVDIGHFKVT